LGEGIVSALQLAAIIGREFSFNILRRLTVLHENELLDALDTALVGHLLAETATGYHFRHDLIRQVMYDTQSLARRARLHTLAAKTIETIYAADLSPHVETLAHHYGRSDNRPAGLPYLLQAGQKAAALFAFEVAVVYFEQALTLMDEFGLGNPAMRWQILEPLGWWGIILADTLKSVRRFEAALALPSGSDWQPAPTDRVRVHRGAAVALITAGDTDAAEVHLMTALELMKDSGETADYALLLYNVAQLHWHRNEFQQAFAVAQRSLDIAERLNDPAAIARAFEMLALACHSTGDWQQGLLFEEKRAQLTGSVLDVTEAFDVHL
jgi:tetratricopeptide (TPR) repeat protein